MKGMARFALSRDCPGGNDAGALGQCEIEEIVSRKLRALQAVQSGTGAYDRLLMTTRSLAATTTVQRGRLLNNQQKREIRLR